MNTNSAIFNRTERLLGERFMEFVATRKAIIFGVGGVGSWCAEGLVRSGVKHLTLVDSDKVSITNVNRQLMATTKTVGRVKVEALKERLLEINPEAEIIALQEFYDDNTAESFHLEGFDYIVDAIDSLDSKMKLIMHASSTDAFFVSSMGAALKMDPTRIKVAEFWKVLGCPLGRALRKKMSKQGLKPLHKFPCVYSDELLENIGPDHEGEEEALLYTKAQVNGTTAHVTAIFGFTISGLILQDIAKKSQENC